MKLVSKTVLVAAALALFAGVPAKAATTSLAVGWYQQTVSVVSANNLNDPVNGTCPFYAGETVYQTLYNPGPGKSGSVIYSTVPVSFAPYVFTAVLTNPTTPAAGATTWGTSSKPLTATIKIYGGTNVVATSTNSFYSSFVTVSTFLQIGTTTANTLTDTGTPSNVGCQQVMQWTMTYTGQ